MKISEFAQRNQVTAKMLRHYDDIGLLKPASIDAQTGYRLYEESQAHRLNWILILKNLEFSLMEIKSLLDGPVSSERLILGLTQKRVGISSGMNEQIQKKLQIDRLILLLEAEGFIMDRKINLMELTEQGVHDLKKQMPNTEMFLEEAQALLRKVELGDSIGILRVDLCQFKAVNDIDGFEVGDKVILACYQSLEESLKPYGGWFAIGRAGGDEFTAIVKGDQDTLTSVGQAMVAHMKAIDFRALGCHKQVSLYCGALVAENGPNFKLRQMIDDTHESLQKAKKLGPDSVIVEHL